MMRDAVPVTYFVSVSFFNPKYIVAWNVAECSNVPHRTKPLISIFVNISSYLFYLHNLKMSNRHNNLLLTYEPIKIFNYMEDFSINFKLKLSVFFNSLNFDIY